MSPPRVLRQAQDEGRWPGRDPLFTSAGAVLMGSDDGGVDHRVFVVGIIGQGLEKIPPNAFFSPTRETPVRVAPAPEALGQIAPRRASAGFSDHGLDEKPVAAIAVPPHRARTARQQIFNPRELVVPQSMAFYRKAS